MNVSSALQSAQNAGYECFSPSPYAPQLLEQPPAAVNYGEANCQANQDDYWTSEKEVPYHNNHQALARLLGGFRGLGSPGYSVLICPCQALAMLGHLGLFLCSPSFSSFLLGFPGKLVLLWKLLVYHLISYEPRIKSRSF